MCPAPRQHRTLSGEWFPWLATWLCAVAHVIAALRAGSVFGALDTLALLVTIGVPWTALRGRRRHEAAAPVRGAGVYRTPCAQR